MQEIFVPALGMASDSVYLTEWLKQPGELVDAGEVVASIETDKAELEIEAPAAGVLGRHRFEGGSDVPSGATIAVVLAEGETEADDVAVEATAEGTAIPAPVGTEAVTGSAEPGHEASLVTGPRTHNERRRDPANGELEPYLLSPRARATGSGAEAQPVAAEPVPATPRVDAAGAAPAAPTPGTDRHRAAVSAAVSRSWSEIPHFAAQREVRVEPLFEVQRGFRALSGDVTLTDVIAKVYGLALMQRFGTSEINLGLAVATARGVAIPVITNVARRDILDIARIRRAAVERAMEGRYGDDDGIVPQSTISNLGAYGVDSFTGIVPVGQTSILTVGVAADRAVVENGSLVIGKTMNVTLNVDHREWDGQHVGEVLKKFADIAAQPFLLTGLAH